MKNSKIFLRQSFIMSSMVFESLGCGFIMGYPATLLPALERENSDIKINAEDGSTIVSCRGFGYLLNLLVINIIMYKYGRKIAQIATVAPAFLAWLIGYFASSKEQLIVMSALLGLSMGGFVAGSALTIAEYSTPKCRGIFLMLKTAFTSTGTMVIHIMGTYLHWRTAVIYAVIPSVLSAILACFWPESPYWLASNGKFQECAESFKWLRGDDEADKEELKEMIMKHKKRLSAVRKDNSVVKVVKENVMYLKNSDLLKPLFVMMMMICYIELSGRFAVTTYSVSIINSVAKDESTAYNLTMLIDLLSLLCNFASTIFVKYFKRRTLILSTGHISFVCLSSCALITYLSSKDLVPSFYSWISLVLFILYLSIINLGMLPVIIGVYGEIFPVIYRGIAGVTCGSFIAVLNTFVIKITPYLTENLGVHGAFTTFSICMLIIGLILQKILPETKDMTIQEIERYWEGKSNNMAEDKSLVYENV